MTNTQSLGTIEATNPVLAVAPLKEETEMLRATDKITALYCRLSVVIFLQRKNLRLSREVLKISETEIPSEWPRMSL